jgi:hypothetical protein
MVMVRSRRHREHLQQSVVVGCGVGHVLRMCNKKVFWVWGLQKNIGLESLVGATNCG